MSETRRFGQEYLNVEGQPEDAAWIEQQHTQDVRQEFPRFPEVKTYLEEIDFPVLRSLLAEHFRRSGLDDSRMNFQDPGNFDIQKKHRITFAYNPESNRIQFADTLVSQAAEYLEIDPKTFLTAALTHEEIHAVSHTVCSGLKAMRENALKKNQFAAVHSGYQSITVSHKHAKDRAYFLFDEGVTELLTREVLAEYQRHARSTISDQQFETLQNAYESGRYPYEAGVRFVRLFIEKMSEETGVDQKVVWQAIIRGKLEGQTFTNPEFHQEISELLTPELIETMQKASTSKEITQAIRIMYPDRQHPRPSVQQRLRSLAKKIKLLSRFITNS